MKNIVVTGSIAYDHLMTFDGEFADSLIADQLKNLSVSFLTSSHKFDFGGCGTNISYNLKLLAENPILLGAAGNDFAKYEEWLTGLGIKTNNVFIDKDALTSAAYVLTDKKQNQIAIFSPVSDKVYAEELGLKEVDMTTLDCGIIGPDLPARMLYLSKYFQKIGLKYIADPGQAIPGFMDSDLREFIADSVAVIANDYEVEMLKKKLGIEAEDLVKLIKHDKGFVIMTTGEKGCELLEDGKWMNIAAVSDAKVVDVTGCGDAFRAGFISGYVEGKSLTDSCKMGNVMASFALEIVGTQHHKISPEEWQKRLG